MWRILATAIDVVRGPANRRARDRSNVCSAAVVLLAGISLVGAALPALHAQPLPPPAGRPAPGPLPLQPSAAGTLREVHPAPFPFRCVAGHRCIDHRIVVYSRCYARVTHLYCWR
jgi:hypothetical protein